MSSYSREAIEREQLEDYSGGSGNIMAQTMEQSKVEFTGKRRSIIIRMSLGEQSIKHRKTTEAVHEKNGRDLDVVAAKAVLATLTKHASSLQLLCCDDLTALTPKPYPINFLIVPVPFISQAGSENKITPAQLKTLPLKARIGATRRLKALQLL
jgi:hypothetical protein